MRFRAEQTLCVLEAHMMRQARGVSSCSTLQMAASLNRSATLYSALRMCLR